MRKSLAFRQILPLIILFIFPGASSAQNFTGKWVGELNGYPWEFHFWQMDSFITGYMLNLEKEGNLPRSISGIAKGREIQFSRQRSKAENGKEVTLTEHYLGYMFYNEKGLGGIFSYKDEWEYSWYATRSGEPVPKEIQMTQPDHLPGVWEGHVNYFEAKLEFSKQAAGYSGRMQIHNTWVTLSSISFDPASGKLSFIRDDAAQNYSGQLDNGKISGLFDNAYSWSVSKIEMSMPEGGSQTPASTPPPKPNLSADPPAKPSPLPSTKPQPAAPDKPTQTAAKPGSTFSIAGMWKIVANGYPGMLEVTGQPGKWTAKMNLHNYWEEIQDFQFNAHTGELSFYRTDAGQHYKGKQSGSSISGKFDDAYDWSAELQRPYAVTSDAGISSKASDVAGNWKINANGFVGLLELKWDGKEWSGRINLHNYWELLENVTVDMTGKQVSFYRKDAGQSYKGTINGPKISGTFDGSYAWEADKLP
jgi:hypothetical protein